jgi:Tfp pilus assembly protein PilO
VEKSDKFVVIILGVFFIAFIVAMSWDGYASDKLLNDVVVELSQGRVPSTLTIKNKDEFGLQDFTKDYEVLNKDSNVVWGQLYRVKFTSGHIYHFTVSPGIIQTGQVLISDKEKKL